MKRLLVAGLLLGGAVWLLAGVGASYLFGLLR